jgi:hypothetical protein
VAVKVRARYWEYKSTIKTKYESLKDEVVPTTLAVPMVTSDVRLFSSAL